MPKTQDRKVTLSLNAALVSAVDGYVAKHPETNRSAVVENALMGWYQHFLDQADIDYYSSETAAEKASDESWAEITTAAAEEIFG